MICTICVDLYTTSTQNIFVSSYIVFTWTINVGAYTIDKIYIYVHEYLINAHEFKFYITMNITLTYITLWEDIIYINFILTGLQ